MSRLLIAIVMITILVPNDTILWDLGVSIKSSNNSENNIIEKRLQSNSIDQHLHQLMSLFPKLIGNQAIIAHENAIAPRAGINLSIFIVCSIVIAKYPNTKTTNTYISIL